MVPRLVSLLLLASLTAALAAPEPAVVEADIIIFGGTSSGVAAAVQARRLGKSVAIAEWTPHLGGLTTGGLGATDIGNKGAIGGIAREFYEQIATYYARPEAWKWAKQPPAEFEQGKAKPDPVAEQNGRPTKWSFEPHVAMEIYQRWLREAQVPLYLGESLAAVKKEGARLVEFTTESGRIFRGKMFIDASYEGDLMAKAGVGYHVGREANATFGETLNGVRAETPGHQFQVPVDPYVKPGDPTSGLIPLIQAGEGGKPGEGDRSVQAYSYRLCMTRTLANQVPWAELKPPTYDEKQYELLARYIEAMVQAGKPPTGIFSGPSPMPNDKTDTNNAGGFSTDFIGGDYAYPDADYATRERIAQAHRDYILGMYYFLSTSPRVPEATRAAALRWGLAKDEFPETGHFPSQLYVREARRMISDYVMTEDDCRWKRQVEDGVALGAYGMDSHNCQRLVQNGVVRNEGNVEVGVRGPYPVSYRSLIPKAEEAENLLVPVCLSASHIAYGSIRMEPVFMITGQSSATAAAIAIDDKVPVQQVLYAKLRQRLLADGQIIAWTGAAKPAEVAVPTLPGIVLEDTAAELKGEWKDSTVGHYKHDDDAGKGQKSATYRPVISEAGTYEILFHYKALGNRSDNVPVTIKVEGADAKVIALNQKEAGENGATSLGSYQLAPGKSLTVTISNEGTQGHVVLGTLQLVKQ